MNWEKTAFGSLLLTGIYGGLLLIQRCNGCGTARMIVRKRETLDGWHNTDIFGKPLRFAALSSKLTQVANFQGTICKVAGEDYLLRRINGIEEPVVVRANEARKVMMAVAVEMTYGHT
jgi:hypothetical protein